MKKKCPMNDYQYKQYYFVKHRETSQNKLVAKEKQILEIDTEQVQAVT